MKRPVPSRTPPRRRRVAGARSARPRRRDLSQKTVSMGPAGFRNGTSGCTFVIAEDRNRRVGNRRSGKRAKIDGSDAENVMATIPATSARRSSGEAPDQSVERNQQGAAARGRRGSAGEEGRRLRQPGASSFFRLREGRAQSAGPVARTAGRARSAAPHATEAPAVIHTRFPWRSRARAVQSKPRRTATCARKDPR